MYNNLTPRQISIIEYIKSYTNLTGYPPTVREIATNVGLRSTSTVHSHLSTLDKLGYIKRDPTKPRAITIHNLLEEAPKVPKYNFKHSSIFNKIIDNATGIYQVQGDNMRSIGINNNDCVLVDFLEKDYEGKVVLVCIHNEFYLIRRYFRDNHIIKLQAENNTSDCFFLPSRNVEVVGIVDSVIKNIS